MMNVVIKNLIYLLLSVIIFSGVTNCMPSYSKTHSPRINTREKNGTTSEYRIQSTSPSMKLGVAGVPYISDEKKKKISLTILNKGVEISVISGGMVRPIQIRRNEQRTFQHTRGWAGFGCEIGKVDRRIPFDLVVVVSGLDASVTPRLYEGYADGP